jgi:hypothetical protein
VPLHPETQAYINEARNPSVQSQGALRNALVAFAPIVNKVIDQASVYSRLAQVAELAETNANIDASLKDVFQKVPEIKRRAGEIIRYMRELAQVEKELREAHVILAERASAAGYTIPPLT